MMRTLAEPSILKILIFEKNLTSLLTIVSQGLDLVH